MAPRKAPKEVFLSHSSRDRRFVLKLAQFLRSKRIRYWYSETHIVGAKQWHDEIGHSLKRCNWLIVVLTPNSVRSKWVKHELLFALRENQYNGRIIPLLLRECRFSKLSWTLSGFEFVDFTGTFEIGCRQLMATWKKRK